MKIDDLFSRGFVICSGSDLSLQIFRARHRIVFHFHENRNSKHKSNAD